MRLASRWIGALAALLPLALPTVTAAQDTLKLAIGQRGNWEQSAPEIGSRAGIFKKYDLNIERTYTAGAGETLDVQIRLAGRFGPVFRFDGRVASDGEVLARGSILVRKGQEP